MLIHSIQFFKHVLFLIIKLLQINCYFLNMKMHLHDITFDITVTATFFVFNIN